jgi:cold shock protein
MRLVGRVKWFNGSKGFGWINTEKEGDVFVHHSAIVGRGFQTLAQGDQVSFDISDARGHQAVNVRIEGSES